MVPEVLELIQERLRAGDSYRAVARHLTQAGHPMSHEFVRKHAKSVKLGARKFDGFDEDVLWLRDLLENTDAGRAFMQTVKKLRGMTEFEGSLSLREMTDESIHSSSGELGLIQTWNRREMKLKLGVDYE